MAHPETVKIIKECLNQRMIKQLLVVLVVFVSLFTLILIVSNPPLSLSPQRQDAPVQQGGPTAHRDQLVLVNPAAVKDVDFGNIPYAYTGTPSQRRGFNRTCAPFPDFFSLRFNVEWQVQQTSFGTLQLLNAFLDDRPINPTPKIRIVGMLSTLLGNRSLFCQMWPPRGGAPRVVPAAPAKYLWHESWGTGRPGTYQPYLFTCEWRGPGVPQSVSLVEGRCERATNNLRVLHEPPPRRQRRIGVCVKGLSYPRADISVRLAEWIELVLLLGADQIVFYEFGVHPTTRRLLDHYERGGRVRVLPLTLLSASNNPFFQSAFLRARITERRLQEVIPYNDCLYRSMAHVEFVAVLDIDEVIVPAWGAWPALLDQLGRAQAAPAPADSFAARNVYFLDERGHRHDWFRDAPPFMHMVQHVLRARNYTPPGEFVKCFHRTATVVAVHNHFPLECAPRGDCRTVAIDTRLAHLQHYRNDCVRDVRNCDKFRQDQVMDTRVWNFKEPLVARVTETLLRLGVVRPGPDYPTIGTNGTVPRPSTE